MSALVALCRARASASSSLFNSLVRPAFRSFSTGTSYTPIDFSGLFLRSKNDALDSLNIYMTFLVSNFISYCLCEEHDYVLKFPVFYAFFF